MASAGGLWGPKTLHLLRVAVSRTATAVRTKFTQAARPLSKVEHNQLRNGSIARQPIHPVALLKQQKSGAAWFSTGTAKHINNVVRRYLTQGADRMPRLDRTKFPSSRTSRGVAQFSGRAPFASTLRPNLTGGAIPRTAGGYSIGGGARYFSHTPAAPAQIVQNVSQAMRAFFLSGQKLRYDGLGPRGERKYRAVSGIEDEAMHKLTGFDRSQPGAFVDFTLSLAVTALSPLAAAVSNAAQTHGFRAATTTLDTEGFLDVLSADFGRIFKEFTAIYADLDRLKQLGGLPIALEQNNTLRVRFPGVDAETVERLCDDIGITRGLVGEDADFALETGVDVALKFPYAPDEEKALSSPGGSAHSLQSRDFDNDISSSSDSFVHAAFAQEAIENPWLTGTEIEGYESVSPPLSSGDMCSTDFEGFEGIYRFIEECDRGRGRLG